jgi:uncharacterized protein (TIGR01777 family)
MAARIVITGGTGFIGRVLTGRLTAKGYEVVVLTRSPDRVAGSLGEGVIAARWDGKSAEGWAEHADGAYGIVNLAGANIASGKWTPGIKRRILESRLDAGKAVSDAVESAARKPRVVVQASAIGYYGDSGEDIVDESFSSGSGFLADVAGRWEETTSGVGAEVVRHIVIRTAVVLGRGGFLSKVTPPFKMFVGGPLGGGRQWISWIHIADETGAICFLLEREDLSGAFNLAAPTPERNADFYRALGRVLGRPAWIRTPAFALRLALGEMADELILPSQRVLPRRLVEAGYRFEFPDLGSALSDVFGPGGWRQGT